MNNIILKNTIYALSGVIIAISVFILAREKDELVLAYSDLKTMKIAINTTDSTLLKDATEKFVEKKEIPVAKEAPKKVDKKLNKQSGKKINKNYLRLFYFG